MNVKIIRVKCAENDLTLASLERKLGIGNGTIARWAHANPHVDLVKKVADFFGCTVDELLR